MKSKGIFRHKFCSEIEKNQAKGRKR